MKFRGPQALNDMHDKAELILSDWVKGEPFAYRCSLCGQRFLPPEDRSPKEGMAEVWAAFMEHVREERGESCRSDSDNGEDT
ncbi:MAG: hypothetical protein ACRD3T_08925 [Terriglobia bacterium]